MATRITSESVPKLEADGSNFWKWKTAMTLLAAMLDATNILNGRDNRPKSPSYAGLIPASESIDLTDIDLTNDEDLSRMSRTAQYEKDRAAINDSINSVAHKTKELIARWEKLDAALRMAMLNTLPRDLYNAVANQSTAALQFQKVVRRFEEEGLNEACSAWSDFFKLRCADFTSTQKFTDTFHAKLNRLDDFSLTLPEKGAIFQFILAIEDTYAEYARQRRHDMRNDRNITVEAMIAEINDEARRDDPTGGGKNNKNGRRSGHNKDKGAAQTPAQNDSKPKLSVGYCDHCKHDHFGFGANCYRKFPHLAPPGWREKAAERIAAYQAKQAAQAGSHTAQTSPSTANVALRGQQETPSIDFNADTTDVGVSFAFCATAEIPDRIAEVSERAMRLADRADYRNRTIVDTGATDHICNDYAKFIKFDSKPTCAYIRTGAGLVKVNATGTIKMGILCVDGNINNVTFSNV
ncbi:hypothetical protein Ptr902_09929 [Pyrenophora tritici-repentis]|nr:hypothetical protein Ptr902_09929 [Pyrenophora tritici-repentis]